MDRSSILEVRSQVQQVQAELQARSRYLAERGLVPQLFLLQIGDQEADRAYAASLERKGRQLGIEVRKPKQTLSPERPEQALTLVRELNCDPQLDGILLLRPLEDSALERELCQALSQTRDVDVCNPETLGRFYAGLHDEAPCTAEACLRFLRYLDYDCRGKQVLIVGRSPVVGRPLAELFLRAQAAVSLVHSQSTGSRELVQTQDLVVLAAGRRQLPLLDHLRSGQLVLDVGIHSGPDGQLQGDADAEELIARGISVSAVPGGVGALTSLILLERVIRRAETRLLAGAQDL